MCRHRAIRCFERRHGLLIVSFEPGLQSDEPVPVEEARFEFGQSAALFKHAVVIAENKEAPAGMPVNLQRKRV